MPRKKSNLPRDIIEANVKLILRIRELTHADLAKAMGVASSRVGAMLSAPTERSVAAIAKALNVHVEWLVDPAMKKRSAEELQGGCQ